MAIQMTRAEYETKYGAAPVLPAAPTSAPIKMTQAEYDAKYGAQIPAAPTKPTIHDTTASITKDAGKLIRSIPEAAASGVQQTKQGAGSVLDAVKTHNVPEFITGATKAGAGIVSTLAAPLAPIGKVIAPALNAVADKVSDIPAVQKFADSIPGQVTSDTAAFLTDAGTIAGGVLGAKPAARAVMNTTKAAVALPGKISTAATDALSARRAANAAKDAQNVDHLAGSIVQGTTADIAKAKTALTAIDPSTVKTYADLKGALQEKITNISQKHDAALSTKTDVKKLPDLTVSQKVGDASVSHNYVEDAIAQLKDLYAKTNDVANAEHIKQLEAKANGQGLSAKELNDLAKEHGQKLNAFNANGQAASGLTKQAAENTRTGLKTTARDMFGDPVSQQTDEVLSSLIRTRDLAATMEEKVNQLQQKIKTRTLGEKAGRLAGQVLNLVGLNSPKGFVEYFLGRGTGLKTLNPLDLEAKLQKDLTTLQDALKDGQPPAVVERKLQEFIDAQSNSNQALKPGETLQATQAKAVTLPKNIQAPINKDIPQILPQDTTPSTATPKKNIFEQIKDTPNKQGGFIKVTLPKSLPEPAKIAKNMDAADFKVVRNYLDLADGHIKAGGKEDFAASAAIDGLLDAMGIKAFPTEKAKVQYLAALRDHFQDNTGEGRLPSKAPSRRK